MYPHERSLVKKMADKPFSLIGVNTDSNRTELKKVLKKEEITWRSFWNGKNGTKGPITAEYKVQGFPTMMLLDGNGVIRFKWLGSPGGEKLDKAIEAVLAEMEKEGKAAP
jgi:hypothetical protein